MSRIKAETKELFPCDSVELIYISCSFVHIGTAGSIYLFSTPILFPHIFKAADNMVLFKRRYKRRIEIYIQLVFFFMRKRRISCASVKCRMNNYLVTSEISASIYAELYGLLNICRSFGAFGNIARKRSMYLTEFDTVFFCGLFCLFNIIP